MKEQTFTELEGRGRYDSAGSADQWNNLDSILGRLHHSSAKAAAGFNVPEERIVQQETPRVITDIIQRLKPRERLIFESHFFDQLSPQEIADLFQLFGQCVSDYFEITEESDPRKNSRHR